MLPLLAVSISGSNILYRYINALYILLILYLILVIKKSTKKIKKYFITIGLILGITAFFNTIRIELRTVNPIIMVSPLFYKGDIQIIDK